MINCVARCRPCCTLFFAKWLVGRHNFSSRYAILVPGYRVRGWQFFNTGLFSNRRGPAWSVICRKDVIFVFNKWGRRINLVANIFNISIGRGIYNIVFLLYTINIVLFSVVKFWAGNTKRRNQTIGNVQENQIRAKVKYEIIKKQQTERLRKKTTP